MVRAEVQVPAIDAQILRDVTAILRDKSAAARRCALSSVPS